MGLAPAQLFQAMPLRLFGVMANDTLLAIPFFTLMGLILERSGMAEDLLDTVGRVFGPVRGGIALAVVLVGAMLAATTGVVAASVISMGLISLPIMMRYGYSRTVAAGTIIASGTLAQIIPPSLVLIVIADQLGRSVGDITARAFIPSFMLVGVYVLFVVVLAIVRPRLGCRRCRPRLAARESRRLERTALARGAERARAGRRRSASESGTSGSWPPPAATPMSAAPVDETVVMALCAGIGAAFVIALLDKLLRLRAAAARSRGRSRSC
jgi:GntP family gluconate:H+ symporter